MSKRAAITQKMFETFPIYNSEKLMSLISIIHQILSFFIVYCAFPTFVFLLVFTLGLRESDSKLQIRELMRGGFKKFF
jgi:hypothetical protein